MLHRNWSWFVIAQYATRQRREARRGDRWLLPLTVRDDGSIFVAVMLGSASETFVDTFSAKTVLTLEMVRADRRDAVLALHELMNTPLPMAEKDMRPFVDAFEKVRER